MTASSVIDDNLPLIDLHRHLDGNVRLETILDLGRQHNLPLPAWDVETLRPHVQVVADGSASTAVKGVMAFIAKFKWMMAVLVDEDACSACGECVDRCWTCIDSLINSLKLRKKSSQC